MSKIRKINVSEIEGNNPGGGSILPVGVITLYESSGDYFLRVHDGETDGGVALVTDTNQLVSIENNNTFAINNTGDVVFSGSEGGRNRGLVWDYGAVAGGVDSTVRQDANGLIIRAWTEVGDGTFGAPVNIVTNQDANTNTWTFDGNGAITLPRGSVINETSNTVIISPPGAGAGQSLVIRPTSIGIISDHPSGFASGDTITITVVPNNYNSANGSVDYTFTGCTAEQLGRALTGTLTASNESMVALTWTVPISSDITTFTFTLSNPTEDFQGLNNSFITLTGTGSSETSHIHLVADDPANTDIYLGDDDQYVKIEKNGGDVVIGANSNTKHWTFDTNGDLTLPDGGAIRTIYGYIDQDTDTNNEALRIGGGNGVVIKTDEDGKTWKFDNAGNLTLPNDGQIIRVSSINAGEDTIVTDGINSIALAPGAQMDLFGFPFTVTPTRGQLTITGNVSTIGTTEALGTWHYQTINNYTYQLYTDNTYSTLVDASEWTPYTGGGSVAITLQNPSANVEINSNGFKSTFGNTGVLTLPGDVVNTEGVSQLANRVRGSWTLLDDSTATYSFTVPTAGTYTMWVEGNIPNGIIMWNATVSVSNSNVPAIGTQYAWNYTGGGTPIELINIPNQIRGVTGTISTDDTYAGTTSNRFDFDISNNSGAEQTVYYGYTKIS